MTQHCTIIVDLDSIGCRARVRDAKLIIDVPDDKLDELRAYIGAEVSELKDALHREHVGPRG